ncbi:MAG: hypothetical protein ABI760_03105 [Ferruginibacter sp.]
MRFPIKFNSKRVNSKFKGILPLSPDVHDLFDPAIDPKEFGRLMSVFKFGNTFKSTSFNRYPKTQEMLSNYHFSNKPIILDIGSSDGLASLGLIENMSFKCYYLTDLNPYVYFKKNGNTIYFYDEKGLLILFASPLFNIYPQELNFLFSRTFFNKTNRIDKKLLSDLNLLRLVNPLIKISDSKLEFHKYDMFEAWPKERADLIILGNILNRTYFNDDEITRAINNLRIYCNEGALFAIIDNRPNVEEKSSIFKLSHGKLSLEHRINGGTEIENLVMQIKTGNPVAAKN